MFERLSTVGLWSSIIGDDILNGKNANILFYLKNKASVETIFNSFVVE